MLLGGPSCRSINFPVHTHLGSSNLSDIFLATTKRVGAPSLLGHDLLCSIKSYRSIILPIYTTLIIGRPKLKRTEDEVEEKKIETESSLSK